MRWGARRRGAPSASLPLAAPHHSTAPPAAPPARQSGGPRIGSAAAPARWRPGQCGTSAGGWPCRAARRARRQSARRRARWGACSGCRSPRPPGRRHLPLHPSPAGRLRQVGAGWGPGGRMRAGSQRAAGTGWLQRRSVANQQPATSQHPATTRQHPPSAKSAERIRCRRWSPPASAPRAGTPACAGATAHGGQGGEHAAASGAATPCCPS